MDINLNGAVNCKVIEESDGNLFNATILPENDVKTKGSFLLRPLNVGDYQKGYLDLLSQLTRVGEVDEKSFLKCFLKMKDCKDCYYIIVVEDIDKQEVVGSSSLVIEYKFVHNTGLRGRLEDVVVKDTYRGKQLGRILVETVKKLAIKLGVYKLSLDCDDRMIRFYESLDFKREDGRANSMVIRFSD